MNLKDLLEEYKYDSDFIYEGLILDISTQLKNLMIKKGLNKLQLAEKMDVKPSYITKIFGGSNISLKTIAKILAAIEVNATITIGEWSEKTQTVPDKDMLRLVESEILERKDETKDFCIAA